LLDNLSFSKFNAYFVVNNQVNLPFFTGSTFRGVIGHALRKVHYGFNSKVDCAACSINNHCKNSDLYAYLFESPSDHPLMVQMCQSQQYKTDKYPQPLILDPPKGGRYHSGEFLSLSFTLVGQAIALFPFTACALTCLEDSSIGQGNGKILLKGIENGFPSENGSNNLIYDGHRRAIVGPGQVLDLPQIKQWIEKQYDPKQNIKGLSIRFLTPFRFKEQNRLGYPLTFKLLMRSVLRRITLLSVHSPLSGPIDHKRLLELADQIAVERSWLKWYDWQRYSDRQKTKMKLGGVVGEIVFSGNLYEFLPYLKTCEFLNVGKGGTFGLGKYRINIQKDNECNES